MENLCLEGPFVNERFVLNSRASRRIHDTEPTFGFGGLGSVVFYRTYSRRKENGKNESWSDVIIRCVNGIMSIRKDHLVKNYLDWNEKENQIYAEKMAMHMVNMRFLPPGRGLWACGTDFMYERGSAALNNCGAAECKDLPLAVAWIMDLLMNGCGTGFDTVFEGDLEMPTGEEYTYVIPDSRQGWVTSVAILVNSYYRGNTEWNSEDEKKGGIPLFDYSQIRARGEIIKGFGGESSGPDPLEKLHKRIRAFCECYIKTKNGGDASGNIIDMVKRLEEDGEFFYESEKMIEKIKSQGKAKTYGKTRLVVDIMNSVGSCVVAGNVRRSSEISIGEMYDEEFVNLKNYDLNPERQSIGWMSNNSIRMTKTEHFENLPDISRRISDNGEPGIINLMNISKYGRVGKHKVLYDSRETEEDEATLGNPCSEIPLESFELCNLVEVFPTKCLNSKGLFDIELYLEVLEFATFYSTTVSLLPTHWKKTNAIIAKNRRIGVSMTGIADFFCNYGATQLTKICKEGYDKVRRVNTKLAKEHGICSSIRVTTVKPSGSVSLLVGVSPGIHFPTFKYAIRRVRVSNNHSICKILTDSGVYSEPDVCSDNTSVFEFVINQGNTIPAEEVTIEQQFILLRTLQREWSDNMVSVTIYFSEETEKHKIESVLSQFAPDIKSCSLLPHDKTSYQQAPYERITEDEYLERLKLQVPIDWSGYSGSDGIMPKFCSNDTCM